MNQKVILYWQHDIDLVALSMHPDFSMGKWMKRAVYAYARNEPLTIPLPEPVPCHEVLDTKFIHFVLVNGKDDDVIRVLEGIRSGYRNSAIKAIFRGYLDGVYLAPYAEGADYVTKSRVPRKRVKKDGSLPASGGKSMHPLIRSETPDELPKKAAPVKKEKTGRKKKQNTANTAQKKTAVKGKMEKTPVIKETGNMQQADPQAGTAQMEPVMQEEAVPEQAAQGETTQDNFDLFGAMDGTIL